MAFVSVVTIVRTLIGSIRVVVIVAFVTFVAFVAAWVTVVGDISLAGHGSGCSVELEASLCTNERCKDQRGCRNERDVSHAIQKQGVYVKGVSGRRR